jgi:enoyl-CoA hydratase/carnithine racemase
VGEILLERDGPIVWMRMNRPEAHNAFSTDMIALMADQVRRLAGDREVRVAILCGNGPSFCTGLDVKELARGELKVAFFVEWNRMMRSLRELPIPMVAAIQGHCLAGGTMLTLEVDYRLASDDVRIGLGALRLGILPGTAPEVLPAIVGAAHWPGRPSCATRVARSHGSRACRTCAWVLGYGTARVQVASRTLSMLDAVGYDRAFAEAQQR